MSPSARVKSGMYVAKLTTEDRDSLLATPTINFIEVIMERQTVEQMTEWLDTLSTAALRSNHEYAKKKSRKLKEELEYYSMLEQLSISICQERFLKEVQGNLVE